MLRYRPWVGLHFAPPANLHGSFSRMPLTLLRGCTCTNSRCLASQRYVYTNVPRARLTAKHGSSDNVPDQGRDNPLPDVQTNGDLWRSNPDGHGNKSHIGDNVVESQRNKPKNRPPDTHQLRRHVTALQAHEAGHADQPVAANPAKENHSEIGRDLLLDGVRNHFGFVGIVGKDLAIFSSQ